MHSTEPENILITEIAITRIMLNIINIDYDQMQLKANDQNKNLFFGEKVQ